jgi:dynein heavy chain
MQDMVNKHMGLKFDKVFVPPEGSEMMTGDVAVLRSLLFCDFMTQVRLQPATTTLKPYA